MQHTQSTTEQERSAARQYWEQEARACLRIADGHRERWEAYERLLTGQKGGGPPWKSTAPDGARYLSGGTWSHWTEKERDLLSAHDQERRIWEDRARRAWKTAGHTSHTFAAFAAEHSRPAPIL